jgi:hypothetical protein
VCRHCGCKVIGHGVEKEGTYFCCVHCAEKSGVPACPTVSEPGAPRGQGRVAVRGAMISDRTSGREGSRSKRG